MFSCRRWLVTFVSHLKVRNKRNIALHKPPRRKGFESELRTMTAADENSIKSSMNEGKNHILTISVTQTMYLKNLKTMNVVLEFDETNETPVLWSE